MAPKFSIEQLEQIRNDFKSGISRKELRIKYGACGATIKKALAPIMPQQSVSRRVTEQQVVEMSRLYEEEGYSTRELEAFFPITKSAITEILVKRGAKMKTKGNAYRLRKHALNVSYFDQIDTAEKAYWLGFICCDGSVASGSGVTIGISSEDRYQLEKFKEDIGSDAPIKLEKDPEGHEIATVVVYSKQIIEALQRVGVTGLKRDRTQLPKVDPKFLPSLIRGIVDADGGVARTTRTEVRYEGEVDFRFSLCGYLPFLKAVIDVLCANILVSVPAITTRTTKDGYLFGFTSWGGRNQVNELVTWVYEGGDPKRALLRKLDTAHEILEENWWLYHSPVTDLPK